MTYPLNRFVNIRSVYNPSFSADGRFLAFLTDITGRFQVWQIDLTVDEDGFPWPQQLTFSSDQVLYVTYSPVPGDNRLLFGQDAGGSENLQLHILDAASGVEYGLTAGHEDVMHIPGKWSRDNGSVIFAANRRDPAIFDLYVQAVDGGPAQLVWEHNQVGYLFHAVWSPDNKHIAFVRAAHSAAHDLLELDLETGQVRRLSPADRPARYADISYAPDGRFLYANTDLGSDFLHVARLELSSGVWETLVAPNADTENLAQSPDGRYLAYCTNRDGSSYLELIDLATGVVRPAPEPATRPGVIGGPADSPCFSADSQRLAFSYSSATRTSDTHIWNFDPSDDALLRKTDSSHGGIPVNHFVAPLLVHYPTFDGREIPAFFYKPPGQGNGNWPAIVFVHGGPESQFRPDFRFFIQYFAQYGYAVLAPNVRGSTGYGNEYSHLDDVEKRMDSVADVAYAARWLASQPEIDAGKVIIYGGSYGGFMVLASMTTYPDLWAAGVNVVGISNFVSFLENTSGYRRAHRESEYGSLATDREFLQSISPLNQVDKIVAPLMVIHGANDPRVPLSEAEQLVTALQEREVPVRFLVFDDEGHGIVKLKNRLVLYPAVVEFLNEVLGT